MWIREVCGNKLCWDQVKRAAAIWTVAGFHARGEDGCRGAHRAGRRSGPDLLHRTLPTIHTPELITWCLSQQPWKPILLCPGTWRKHLGTTKNAREKTLGCHLQKTQATRQRRKRTFQSPRLHRNLKMKGIVHSPWGHQQSWSPGCWVVERLGWSLFSSLAWQLGVYQQCTKQ